VLTKLEITEFVGSQIPGVLEADTSTRFGAVGETGKPPQPGPPWYPMNVMDFPSIERFSASSDLELKLVTIRSLGIGSVPKSRPSVERLSRKIGELTPKLPSEPELFQTLCESLRLGASPLSLATPHVTVTFVVPPAVSGTATTVLPFGPPAHPRGNTSPIVTVAAVPWYTLRLNTRLSSLNSK
jgi:hypothetical protein